MSCVAGEHGVPSQVEPCMCMLLIYVSLSTCVCVCADVPFRMGMYAPSLRPGSVCKAILFGCACTVHLASPTDRPIC